MNNTVLLEIRDRITVLSRGISEALDNWELQRASELSIRLQALQEVHELMTGSIFIVDEN